MKAELEITLLWSTVYTTLMRKTYLLLKVYNVLQLLISNKDTLVTIYGQT